MKETSLRFQNQSLPLVIVIWQCKYNVSECKMSPSHLHLMRVLKLNQTPPFTSYIHDSCVFPLSAALHMHPPLLGHRFNLHR